MKTVTQTDAEELAMLRTILNSANAYKVEMREAMSDCLAVVYWKHRKRELAKIRRKYDELAGLGRGRKQ